MPICIPSQITVDCKSVHYLWSGGGLAERVGWGLQHFLMDREWDGKIIEKARVDIKIFLPRKKKYNACHGVVRSTSYLFHKSKSIILVLSFHIRPVSRYSLFNGL